MKNKFTKIASAIIGCQLVVGVGVNAAVSAAEGVLIEAAPEDLRGAEQEPPSTPQEEQQERVITREEFEEATRGAPLEGLSSSGGPNLRRGVLPSTGETQNDVQQGALYAGSDLGSPPEGRSSGTPAPQLPDARDSGGATGSGGGATGLGGGATGLGGGATGLGGRRGLGGGATGLGGAPGLRGRRGLRGGAGAAPTASKPTMYAPQPNTLETKVLNRNAMSYTSSELGSSKMRTYESFIADLERAFPKFSQTVSWLSDTVSKFVAQMNK